MKKGFKKFISIILAVILVSSVAAPCFALEPTGLKNYSDVPIIYFQGQGAEIYNADGTNVYPVSLPEGYILDQVKECMPILINAIKTDDWTEYTERLNDIMLTIYEPCLLDKNGEPRNGSHINFYWSDASLKNIANSRGGKYYMRDFNFYMDWRIDPFVTADQLKAYIEGVKRATGSEKVNLVCRCEANNILGAYWAKYGYEDFNCVEMYISTLFGAEAISGIFSGNLYLDAASLLRFKEQMNFNLSDPAMNEFLNATIGMLEEVYGLDGMVAILNPVLWKIYAESISKIMLSTYGSFPGIWTLVTASDYAKAKRYIFAGKEEEYAGLIEKLDNYDKKVRQKATELLKGAAEAGVKLGVYAKYGYYQNWPVSRYNDYICDGTVTLEGSSFGATTARYTKTLDSAYINAAKKKGTDKYISPDLKVDASTCLFPETTWIIFNSEHREFPDCIHNEVMMPFFASDGTITVSSYESLPQYIYCNDAQTQLTPLTAENGFRTGPERQTPTKTSVVEKLKAFFKAFLEFIKNLLANRNK